MVDIVLSNGTIQIIVLCLTAIILTLIVNNSIAIPRADSLIDSDVNCDYSWLRGNQYFVDNGNGKCNIMERK